MIKLMKGMKILDKGTVSLQLSKQGGKIGPVMQGIQANAFVCVYRAKPKRQYKPRQINILSTWLKKSPVWLNL